jgi:D-glycero-D-manno-heptose 1,7-bisphosphate phosphatase
MKRKALFLDRDGVINEDFGYVHRAEQCIFVDGIFDLVRAANAADYVVAVVTNQAGIARGLYSDEQFHTFMRWMKRAFAERGANLDRVYYCPHHPQAGLGELRQACDCRKPKPGMLERAQLDFDLDMEASILIGDNTTDIEAARRAGVGRAFLLTEEVAQDGVQRVSSLDKVRQIL